MTFPNKWKKHLSETFEGEVEAADEEEIKKIIVESSRVVEDLQNDMEADEKLTALKNELKDLKGGYTDTIKANQAKIKYCVYTLKSRGRL